MHGAIEHVGPYEVLERLGDGGMGTVYRGRDARFDRDVAIKVLHPQLAYDAELVARFKSEAVIQAKLNHPNIATVYDFVAEGPALAIVMELLEGVTLEAAIRATAGKGLPEERAIAIVSRVLMALGFAHRKGLVHRDIKPSNIMLQRFDDEEVVKVLDFGVAKILGSEKLRTATTAKIGTLAYMSPEHIRSPKQVDARSDIYSVGVVLYEALTGELPFDADSEYDMMRAIVEQAPRNRLVPEGCRAPITKALGKLPSTRHASADEFRQDLRQVACAGPPTTDTSVADCWPGDAYATGSSHDSSFSTDATTETVEQRFAPSLYQESSPSQLLVTFAAVLLSLLMFYAGVVLFGGFSH